MSEVIVSWPKTEKTTEYDLRVQLKMERQRCGALIAENNRLNVEIERLRGITRNQLDRNMKAYSDYLRANADDKAAFPKRLALFMALPILGLFGGTILTLAICFGRIL